MLFEVEPGQTIQFDDCGQGNAVIVVPFLGRSFQDYRSVIRRIADSGRRVVVFNPRGIAGSTASWGIGSPSICAEDLLGLAQHLGIMQAHLIGHAYGSRVVRVVAARSPGFVRSMVLAGTGGEVARATSSRPPVVAKAFFSALDGLQRGQASKLSPRTRIAATLIRRFYFGHRKPLAQTWYRGWYPETACRQFEAMEREPIDGNWKRHLHNLLILQGTEDRLSPPRGAWSLQRALGARVRVAYWEGAGHALFPEVGPELGNTIVSFLDRVERPATVEMRHAVV